MNRISGATTSTTGPPPRLRRTAQEPRPAIAEPSADTKPVPAPESILAGPDASWTDGQRELWEHLSPEQRGWLMAMSPGTRKAWMLDPHADKFWPDRLAFQIRSGYLKPPQPPSPPPRPLPATFAELLEELPSDGIPHDWADRAAQWLSNDFGTKADHGLWPQFLLITEGVWRGDIDPAHVISAHRQAMKPGIKKRGAKFWAAFQALSGLNADRLKDPAGSTGTGPVRELEHPDDELPY